MSIDIKNAREKLNLLEELANNPELILTDLYKIKDKNQATRFTNFYYQININDKHILDYLVEHLSKIDVFSNVLIECEHNEITLSVKSIDHDKFNEYDKIMEIDLINQTYSNVISAISNYKYHMNKDVILEREELSDFWKMFVDLNCKKRIANIKNEIKSDKKFKTKVENVFFHIFISKKRINGKLNKQINKVNNTNEYRERQYEKSLKKKTYYKEKAPEQIEYIQKKQEEINAYLNNLGYTREIDTDDIW